MTDTEKIVILKEMTSETNYGILLAYLKIAEEAVINRCYPYGITERVVPDKYAQAQIQIACYLYNKRGAEGETSHNENGINRTYESADIPDSLLQRIMPCCKVVTE